ncbi:MAG: hypothetical protein F7C35_05665 [Desulfurococcales archaeon]|nr:hypothetical protein [Desulfurococcales archaeon]
MSTRLGWIEKAMMLVPGYRGYKKRELLREDDRLIRRYVADLLREASSNLQKAVSEITQKLGSQLVNITQIPGNPIQQLEAVASRLYSIAGEVEHLEMGYQPKFDRLTVEEPELRKLMEIDNAMIGYANVIKETSKQILDQARAQGWFDTRLIITILQSLDEIEKIISERRRFLHGGEPVTKGELGTF